MMALLASSINHVGLIYVDDQLWVMEGQHLWPATAVNLLLLSALGAPISWNKLSHRAPLRMGWIRRVSHYRRNRPNK